MDSIDLIRLACHAGIVWFVSATSLAGQEYEIRLNRPAKVGDRRQVILDMANNTRIKLGSKGSPHDMDGDHVLFEATEKVTSVDEKGRPTALDYLVERFIVKAADGDKELLGKGKVVSTRQDAQAVVIEAKEGLTSDAEWFLESLIGSERVLRNAEVFGTSKPQPVGATWGIDATLFAKDLEHSGILVKPEDLKGVVKLVSVRSADQLVELSAEVTASKFTLTNEVIAMPGPVKTERAALKATFSGLVPREPANRSGEESLQVTVDFTGSKGGGMTVHVSVSRSLRAKYNVLQAGP